MKTLFYRKSFLIALIVIASLFYGAFQLWVNRRLQTEMAVLEQQRLAVDQSILSVSNSVESVTMEIKKERDRQGALRAVIAKTEVAINKIDPDSRWATPPASLPEWNVASPYIWLPKSAVPELPIEIFGKNGELREEVLQVLAVTPAQKQEIKEKLASILKEYHQLELSHVEYSNDHLIRGKQDDTAITIKVPRMDEEGDRYKQQFVQVLGSILGEQRTSLILKTGESWVDDQFAQNNRYIKKEDATKTITLLRRSDGNLELSIHGANSSFGTGGPMVGESIPDHLRPLFSDLLNQ